MSIALLALLILAVLLRIFITGPGGFVLGLIYGVAREWHGSSGPAEKA